MSEWRRTPLAMHQRRGAGGGVRACGARARERAESSGAERRGRGARAAARDSGEQRSGEGTGQREGAERETTSPMVLHCVVGE